MLSLASHRGCPQWGPASAGLLVWGRAQGIHQHYLDLLLFQTQHVPVPLPITLKAQKEEPELPALQHNRRICFKPNMVVLDNISWTKAKLRMAENQF